jgi:glycosyltransferase involved in cell wall biosynthesis
MPDRKKLRVAMLAPVSWTVPPVGYGPWEQVVSNLTEQLVMLGHEVTLFAAAGSRTTARLVPTVPHPFSLWPEEERNAPRRLDPVSGLLEGPPDFRAWEQRHIATCIEAARDGAYDLIHSHLHVHALVFSRLVPCPLVSSLHGAAWVRASHAVFDRYADQPFVSLSDAERQLKPDLNYVATVHNGIDLEAFPLCREKEDYLLFAGRLAPEKGAAEAVAIARRSGSSFGFPFCACWWQFQQVLAVGMPALGDLSTELWQ